MTSLILALILQYSMINNVDPRLTMAVIQVESSYRQNVVGPVGEIGLMQLNPRFFKEYTKEQLADPETNIRLGVAHLAASLKRCRYKTNKLAVVCYNLGIKGGSRLKYPHKWYYYEKVIAAYENVPHNMQSLTLVSQK